MYTYNTVNHSKSAREKFITLTEGFVALTGGHTQASILNEFLNLYEESVSHDKLLAEDNRFDSEPNSAQFRDGWVYQSAKEMTKSIFLPEKNEDKVAAAIKKMVNKGWLDRRSKPRNEIDRVYQYKPNLLKIKSDLNELGYDLPGYKFVLDKEALPQNAEWANTGLEGDTPLETQYLPIPQNPSRVTKTSSETAHLPIPQNAEIINSNYSNSNYNNNRRSVKNFDVKRIGIELSPDWKPSTEKVQIILTKYNDWDEDEIEKALVPFFSYHSGKRSFDWDMTFMDWCHKRYEMQQDYKRKRSGQMTDEEIMDKYIRNLNDYKTRELVTNLLYTVGREAFLYMKLHLMRVGYQAGNFVRVIASKSSEMALTKKWQERYGQEIEDVIKITFPGTTVVEIV